jgi:hypothetical protein
MPSYVQSTHKDLVRILHGKPIENGGFRYVDVAEFLETAKGTALSGLSPPAAYSLAQGISSLAEHQDYRGFWIFKEALLKRQMEITPNIRNADSRMYRFDIELVVFQTLDTLLANAQLESLARSSEERLTEATVQEVLHNPYVSPSRRYLLEFFPNFKPRVPS